MARARGTVLNAIIGYLSTRPSDASVAEIRDAVSKQLGEVAPSSVRSALNLGRNRFESTGLGRYRLIKESE